jgi:hypothetical protein
MPYTKDQGVAPGPEVPWDAGSEKKDNPTLELGSDVPKPFAPSSYVTDSSSTTRSSMKSMGRGGGGDKFIGDDDHVADRAMSLLTPVPSSVPLDEPA